MSGIPVRTAGADHLAYSFVLPGTWARIPLESADQVRAAAKAIVRERAGRDDRLASMRRMMTDELTRTASEAMVARADALWLSLEILPGIPLPGSMLTALRPLEHPELDIRERLATLRPRAEVIEGLRVPMARTRSIARSRVSDELFSLSLEYAVPAADRNSVLVITASAPAVEEVEPYTPLFDSIVDSLRWRAVAGARARS